MQFDLQLKSSALASHLSLHLFPGTEGLLLARAKSAPGYSHQGRREESRVLSPDGRVFTSRCFSSISKQEKCQLTQDWSLVYFYNLFSVVLGLHCYLDFFSSCSEQGLLSSCGAWAFIAMASLAAFPRLHSTGSVVVVTRLSCSPACGIFSDQGLNLCLLH